jgi:hypothetical protein
MPGKRVQLGPPQVARFSLGHAAHAAARATTIGREGGRDGANRGGGAAGGHTSRWTGGQKMSKMVRRPTVKLPGLHPRLGVGKVKDHAKGSDADEDHQAMMADAYDALAGHHPTRKLVDKWWLIDPSNSAVGMWDGFTSLTLIFIAVFTPFEVAFLPAPTSGGESLFVLGRVVDGVFILDMLLQFFLMIPKVGEPGLLESNWRVIAVSYLQGWFILDLVAVSASAFDIIPVFVDVANDVGGRSPLATLRVVRILRLVKLIRLLKASKRIKAWTVKIAMPRATLSVLVTLLECFFCVHWGACALVLVTIVRDSPLETWLATHGYCTPAAWAPDAPAEANVTLDHVCDGVGNIYLTCSWWSSGMLLGAPISMTPHKGPFERYFAKGTGELLTLAETLIVLLLKWIAAVEWITVLARFVQLYNNFDADAREFNEGWDALNRFANYFKVSKADALELRRYYVERAEEARAKSRMRVMNDFSPYLAEKFVWKLSSEWLVRVPCFSLIVERLLTRPRAGLERFLVSVALKMQPAVYVPGERPPIQRLYILRDGIALYKGVKKTLGDSWGAEEVLLETYGSNKNNAHRALAATYLHVLWIDAISLREIGAAHREAFLLCKLWTTIAAAGQVILEDYRKEARARQAVQVGNKEGQISPEEVEQRINDKQISVVIMRNKSGERQMNHEGQTLYAFKYKYISLGRHDIVKDSAIIRQSSHGPGGGSPPSFRKRNRNVIAAVLQRTRQGTKDATKEAEVSRYRVVPRPSKKAAKLLGLRWDDFSDDEDDAHGAAGPTHSPREDGEATGERKRSVRSDADSPAPGSTSADPPPGSEENGAHGSGVALASRLNELTSRFEAQMASQQAMAKDLAALASLVSSRAQQSHADGVHLSA